MSPDRRRIPRNQDLDIDGLPESFEAEPAVDDLFRGRFGDFGGFDFRHYKAIVMRRKGLIALCTVLGVLVFLLRAVSQEEVYSSTTRLLLESGGGLVVLNQKLTYVPSQSMETFTEVLKTDEMMSKVITRLNLPMKPKELAQRIHFEPNHRTNILRVTVTHPEPEKAQAICREVAAIAVEEVNTIYSSSTANAYKTLGEQLEKTKIQLMKAEERIKDFVKSKGYRNLEKENADRLSRLAALTNAYNDAQVAIRSAETELDYQTARLAMTDSLVVRESTHSRPLQVEIVNMETELAKLLTSHTERHPKVVALKRNIERLKQMLEEEQGEDDVRVETRSVNPVREQLLQQVNAGRAEIIRNKARQAELRRLINEVEERLRTAPEDDLALARLTREKKGLENTYYSLLAKYEEARMLKDTAQGNLQILEEPNITGGYRPNLINMALIGAILGQIAGAVLAVLVESLDPRIKFSSKIERQIGVPVVGVIPRLDSEELYIDYSKPKSRIAEAYNIVRANIEYSFPTRDPWSLLVTSGFQGEGKTLTAINLARSMAMDGKKICLVDADLRRTYLHQTFGLEREGGLTEYLSEECGVEEILKDTEFGNFKVITAGRTPLNPSRLLNSQRMEELLEYLRENEYYVIIDSPAVLPIVDTSLLAPKMDGILLILKEEGTQKYTAQKTVERLRRVGANFVGAILNNASTKGYGYYYYYGYRYGYDYGYAEELSEVKS